MAASLTREQERVVTSDARALEVRAGAGSGKTLALVHRVARFAADPHKQPGLLVITFTREATATLERRLRLLLGRDHAVRVSSFHQWAARELPPTQRRFLEVGQGRAIVAQSLSRRPPPPGFARAVGAAGAARDELATRVLGVLSAVKNSDAPLSRFVREAAPALAPWQDALEEMRADYEDVKGDRLDHDDLLIAFRDRLTRSAAHRRETTGMMHHLFVDEYQDVNRIQADIVHAVTAFRGAPRVTVVGDARQSIYAFRGGSPRHLDDFLAPYGRGGRRLVLTTNFRASRRLVAAADDLLAGPAPMRAAPGAARGLPPTLVACPDAQAEAVFVADRVARHLARGVDPAEVAVLCRARFLAASYEEERLTRSSDEAWASRHPDALGASIDALVGLRRVGDAPAAAAKIDASAERLLAAATAGTIQEALEAWADAEWMSRESARAASVLARRSRAADVRGVPSASRLVALPPHPDTTDVTLGTIHASKGLEWDHVLLLGGREGGLPSEHARLASQDEPIEEERRLAYVALTRARHTFTVTWAEAGARRQHEASRFFAGLAANAALT